MIVPLISKVPRAILRTIVPTSFLLVIHAIALSCAPALAALVSVNPVISISGFSFPPNEEHALGNVSHTCISNTAGEVYCWGYNRYGQLGNGSAVTSNLPTAATGFAGQAKQVAAGGTYSCGISTVGQLQCWGNNGDGQLGDGTLVNRAVPVSVVGLTSGATHVSTSNAIVSPSADPGGYQHSCAVTGAEAAVCWGHNFTGQLGNGLTTQSRTPVGVVGLSSGVSSVAAISNASCALTTAGAVWCWGSDSYGQLGAGAGRQDSLVPVMAISGGVRVIIGGHLNVCALTNSGGVKCWGDGGNGMLGNGSTANSYVPVDVTGLTAGVVAISGSGFHACALMSAGTVKCWGYNQYGQLGNGRSGYTEKSTVPVDVVGLPPDVRAIGAGFGSSCAVTRNGRIFCWGRNSTGELGDGTNSSSLTPVRVKDSSGESYLNANANIISFEAIQNKLNGTPSFNVIVSASTGLPVRVFSNTPSICQISVRTVTVIASNARCTLVATQGGDADIPPAVSVIVGFDIGSPDPEADIPTLPQWGYILLTVGLLVSLTRNRHIKNMQD